MNDELFKAIVHAAAFGLACTMSLHNLMEACSERGRRRHWVNVVLYASATVYEARNTYEHVVSSRDV